MKTENTEKLQELKEKARQSEELEVFKERLRSFERMGEGV